MDTAGQSLNLDFSIATLQQIALLDPLQPGRRGLQNAAGVHIRLVGEARVSLNETRHLRTSWSRMPGLWEQLTEGVFTASHKVARALLRPDRVYELAVKLLSPYREVKEADALRELISRSRREKRTAYIHINNRFEGNAIGTIEGILEGG